ncbi:hypothetical protein E4U42_006062 [Claviceps africana]|uniref:Uncharacterized protein n=1 Tax=Claviceps africana TaxID=83212 RepID=A0A8K0J3S2_9HYPO|nr:hypothetical protein E4U42_006062 [Claviceps africana]
MKVAVLFTLVTAAVAHHKCICTRFGEHDKDLTDFGCKQWISQWTSHHGHFDGYSCVNPGLGRGIDSDNFTLACKKMDDPLNEGWAPAVDSYCWG